MNQSIAIVLRKCRTLAEGCAIQNRDILVSEIDRLLAVSARDGITEEMVERALDAARSFLAPKYVIDVRGPWHESDRAAARAMLEAAIESASMSESPGDSNRDL